MALPKAATPPVAVPDGWRPEGPRFAASADFLFRVLVSCSQLGEESITSIGEYGQVGSAVRSVPVLDVDACRLKVAGETVHELTSLAGDQVVRLGGTGLFV